MLKMAWLEAVSYFAGGGLLTNAIPHFVTGVCGRPFQSPFAKPPGQGLSSSAVNVLWGFLNLAIGYVLVCRVGNFSPKDVVDVVAFGFGILVSGVFLARYFGRFHGGNTPQG
jgi:hypothetical protein